MNATESSKSMSGNQQVPATTNPLEIVAQWAAEAAAAKLASPHTFTLATATPEGVPHARTVLSTIIDENHVRFHSSTPTTKTMDLAQNPHVSGVFFWPELGRQAILTGTARELDAEISTDAFPTRPRQLQLVALAYEDVFVENGIDTSVPAAQQSQPSAALPTSAEHIAELYAKHDEGGEATLVRPPSWTTIEFTPVRVDLWQGVGPQLAAHKTRYDLVDGQWQAVEILP